MARKSRPQPQTLSLAEALNILTVDDLRPRVSLLKTSEEPKRKAEFVAVIEKHLEGERLKALWERLDDLQQKAVSEVKRFIHLMGYLIEPNSRLNMATCPISAREPGAGVPG